MGLILILEKMCSYRIYVAIDKISFLWLQQQILPSERHNFGEGITTGLLRQSVGLQTSTHDDILRKHTLLFEENKLKRENTM